MAHPDFRFGGRIFATLGYPDKAWGMVRLSAAQQAEAIARHPEVFQQAAGAWGRSGSTIVLLSPARMAILRPVLRQAYDNLAAKRKAPHPSRDRS